MISATFTTLSGGSWYSFMDMFESTPFWELVAIQSPYSLCPPTHTYDWGWGVGWGGGGVGGSGGGY